MENLQKVTKLVYENEIGNLIVDKIEANKMAKFLISLFEKNLQEFKENWYALESMDRYSLASCSDRIITILKENKIEM